MNLRATPKRVLLGGSQNYTEASQLENQNMDNNKFQSLLKYYLSCMDAEQATQLKLRKNQEYRTHIFPDKGAQEQLFLQGLPELKIKLIDAAGKSFIQQRSADGETLVDLHYGFPIFKDDRDMISPLFFIEVSASFTEDDYLSILPKVKSFSVNRAYFFSNYNAEEIEEICEELELFKEVRNDQTPEIISRIQMGKGVDLASGEKSRHYLEKRRSPDQIRHTDLSSQFSGTQNQGSHS